MLLAADAGATVPAARPTPIAVAATAPASLLVLTLTRPHVSTSSLREASARHRTSAGWSTFEVHESDVRRETPTRARGRGAPSLQRPTIAESTCTDRLERPRTGPRPGSRPSSRIRHQRS